VTQVTVLRFREFQIAKSDEHHSNFVVEARALAASDCHRFVIGGWSPLSAARIAG
jgi:hypothetical protein